MPATTTGNTPSTAPGDEHDLDIDLEGAPEGLFFCQCGCRKQRMPKSTFLQGHDAKLKSALITCAINGGEVHRYEGGLVQSLDPLAYADEYTTMAAQVRTAIESRQAKLARKGAKRAKAASAAATGTNAEARDLLGALEVSLAPATVKAKVGRWAYNGHVVDGRFEYQDAKGNWKVAKKFELV